MNFSLQLNCCYSGEFRLGEKTYRVVFGDANVNGRFDDLLDLEPPGNARNMLLSKGDSVMLTTGQQADYLDLQMLGELWLLGNDLFEAKLNLAESKATLMPITEGLATLRLPVEARRLALWKEGLVHGVLGYEVGKEIRLPKGTYGLLTYQVVKTTDDGDVWRVNAYASTATPSVSLDAGGVTEMTFGEPYVSKVTAEAMNPRSEDQSVVNLAFNIEGSGKEIVTDLSRVSGQSSRVEMSARNAMRPKEPAYKVMTTDGEVVTSGQFEYG